MPCETSTPMQQTFYSQVVGQVVRGQRELRGVSLITMARSVTLASSSGWSRVETGDSAMTLSQLRKAARKLEMEPGAILRQADAIAAQLEDAGVVVHDDKPKAATKWLLGGAAMLALVGAAAAATRATSRKADDQEKESAG